MAKFLLILLVLFAFTSHSQSSDFENAAYNIGLGSFGSAIGAVINKKENEKTGKVFLKGLWQGSIGGALVYGSKKIVTEIPKTGNVVYNWPAKVVNAAGVSIIENAASNRDFWEIWHINISFNRIEIHTKDSFNIHYKVLPISLGITLGSAINRQPEWGLMLRSGEVIFRGTNTSEYIAYNIGHTIVLNSSYTFSDNFSSLAHEFIHAYQFNDFNFTTQFFNKPLNNLRSTSSLFKSLNKYIYWDMHAVIKGGLYELERWSKSYQDNFFEKEARFYTPKKYYVR